MMTPLPCTSAENSVTLDAGQLFPSALEHLAFQSDRGQRARLPGRHPRLLNLGRQPAAASASSASIICTWRRIVASFGAM